MDGAGFEEELRRHWAGFWRKAYRGEVRRGIESRGFILRFGNGR